MHAHYFGTADRPLWGAYHEPCGGRVRDAAVLLCPPIGHEYLRTHWLWRQLALRLSSVGFHVLRFDYSGTGDSWGDVRDVALATWVDDVHGAAEELRDESAARSLSLVGLRFGATLATLAVGREIECEQLVLCDPVIRGREYLDSLRATQRRLFLLSDTAPSPTPADVGEELLGFVYPTWLVREIEAENLAVCDVPRAERISMFSTGDGADCSELARRWQDKSAECQVETVDERPGWTEVSRLGTALLAHRLIEAVTATLQKPAEIAEVTG